MTLCLTNHFKNLFKSNYDKKIKYLIKNIGKYEISNNNITCYINNDIMVERSKKKQNYYLQLNGIDEALKNELKNCLNLYDNFKFIYIIQDMIFEKPLILNSNNQAEIKFINCTFNKEINLNSGNHIIFENNKYFDYFQIYPNNETYLNVNQEVNKFTFINDNYINKSDSDNTLGMNINCNELNLINTSLNSNCNAKININVINLYMYNSKIKSDELNIDAENIINISSQLSHNSKINESKIKKIGSII